MSQSEQISGDAFNHLDRGLAAAFGGTDPKSVLAHLQSRARSELGVHVPEVQVGEDDSPVTIQCEAKTLRDPNGRYQILGELARGGMGVVYKGRDIDLGRDVAMKVLHEKYEDDPTILERFVEEAQIGGQLQHPGIVPVYEFGLQHGQRPYFAMKLVKGETLALQLARRQDLRADQRRLLSAFEQVCQTVAYAHARRVVHRDLKPANVMIGAFGEVQVVDWGFAKILREGGVADERAPRDLEEQQDAIATVRSKSCSGSNSVAGSVFGTPAYISPEQAVGDVKRIDQRSDVFGLGAILCEILSGAPPYLERDGDLLQQAAAGDVSQALYRLRASGAHDTLVELCARCLSRDRAQRPLSAMAVAEALTTYFSALEERTRQAEIDTAKARVRARSARYVAAVSILLVAVAAASYAWVRSESDKRRRYADDLLANAIGDASVRLGRARAAAPGDLTMWIGMDRSLAELDRLTTSKHASVGLSRRGDAMLKTARRELDMAKIQARRAAKDSVMLASLTNARVPIDVDGVGGVWIRSLTQRSAELYSAAFRNYLDGTRLEQLQPQTAITRLREGGIATDLAIHLERWAMICRDLEQIDLSRQLSHVAGSLHAPGFSRELRAALVNPQRHRAALERLAAGDQLRTLPVATISLLCEGLWIAGSRESAISAARLGSALHTEDFAIHLQLALMLDRSTPRRWLESASYYRTAVALRPDATGARLRLGSVHYALRQYDEAIASNEELLRRNPNYGPAHCNLGVALAARARRRLLWGSSSPTRGRQSLSASGREAFARVRHHFEKALSCSPELTIVHVNLGQELLLLGEADAAAAQFEKAISIDAKRARAHRWLGRARERQGKPNAAMQSLDHAIQLAPQDPASHRSKGVVLFRRGQFKRALGCFRVAHGIDPHDAETHFNIAQSIRRLGGTDAKILAERERHLRRATELDPRDARGLGAFGEFLASAGRNREALPLLRRACALPPQMASRWSNLGLVLKRLGQPAAAVEAYSRALRLAPRAPLLHANIAGALHQLERYEDALEHAREATRLDSDYVQGHYNLGVILRSMQRPEAATRSFLRAVQLDPSYADAHLNLGRTQAIRRDYESARASFHRARELYARSQSARAKRQVEWIHRRLKQIENRPRKNK